LYNIIDICASFRYKDVLCSRLAVVQDGSDSRLAVMVQNILENKRQQKGSATLSPYDQGYCFHRACEADPRFSYSLYVPASAFDKKTPPHLIVCIHGTGRQIERTLHNLGEFGRWHNCVILCPLFPAGIQGDRNIHGYKYIREGEIRYDLVLLAMIDEIARFYGFDFAKFMLCGFSGGGHFSHRFLLLHPARLIACSIGAPGSVTLIDEKQSWWLGVGDVASQFGIFIDYAALRQIVIHMAVGSADLETWEITHQPGSPYYRPGANDAGLTRPERLQRLKQSFEAAGLNCTMEIMPGIAHDEAYYINRVQEFFRGQLVMT